MRIETDTEDLATDELTNVLLHGKCAGKIQSSALSDRDGSAELLKQLDPAGEYSVSTVPASAARALPICCCDYDFPETIE